MKFQLFITTKMLKNKDLSSSKILTLINVKMPTNFGILTFKFKINSCSVEMSMNVL